MNAWRNRMRLGILVLVGALCAGVTAPVGLGAITEAKAHTAMEGIIGLPGISFGPHWVGGEVPGVFGGWVGVGAGVGGTLAQVSMPGKVCLRYCETPGRGSVWFAGDSGAGRAAMNFGFELWARYRIQIAGKTFEGPLPKMPDIDLRLADEERFTPYLLDSKVVLEDEVDPQLAFDYGFEIPFVAGITVGAALGARVTNEIYGVSLNSTLGSISSDGDTLSPVLSGGSLTVGSINEDYKSKITVVLVGEPNICAYIFLIKYCIPILTFEVPIPVPEISGKASDGAVTFGLLHSASTPSKPTGPGTREVNEPGTWTTAGSACCVGCPMQYRFDWGDGSRSTWGAASRDHSWSSAGTYYVKAQARCTSDNSVVSGWSDGKAVVVEEHTVSVPSKPSGPDKCGTNQPGTYSTGGSTCSWGHGVEYRFDWGDRDVSTWGAASRDHSWSSRGTYYVKAQARCTSDNSVVSGWSDGKEVVVDEHTVSVSSKPSGPDKLWTNQPGTYSTGGSTCSWGHGVEYRFDWGDGDVWGWGGASRDHSWSSAGTYYVKAQARCSSDNSVLSAWSEAKTVNVDGARFRWGDVTGDGVVGTMDASEILRWKVGLIDRFGGYPSIVKPSYPPAADVSADGVCGTMDASEILRWKVGLISRFTADSNGDGFGPEPALRALGPLPEGVLVSVAAGEGSVGAEVIVPIEINNADGVFGYFVEFRYPAGLADYVATLKGSLTEGWGDPTVNNPQAGRVLIAGAGTQALTGTGSLAQVKLKLKGCGSEMMGLPAVELNDGAIVASGQGATLTVTCAQGTISIDAEPNELNAPWTLVGPEGPSSQTHQGQGDHTFTDMPAGKYTLTWGDVANWSEPEPVVETKELAVGGSITFGGTYTPEGARTVSVPSRQGYVAGEVIVPIEIDNAEGVLGYYVEFDYPAAVADYVATLKGSLTAGWGDPTVSTPQPGRVLIAGAGTQALSGSGSLAQVKLKLKTVGSGMMTLPVVELNDGAIGASGKGAKLAVDGEGPVITGIEPGVPEANREKQWISILGRGLACKPELTLSYCGEEYVIPPERVECVSSTEIRAYVGLKYGGGWCAEVKNPDGSESNIFPFTVSFKITSVEPLCPGARPDRQQVIVRGTGFVRDTGPRESQLFFGYGGEWHWIPEDRRAIDSDRQITAWVYLKWPGPWRVQVKNPGGESNIFEFTVGPAIAGIEPACVGPSAEKQRITIRGCGFVQGSDVFFGLGNAWWGPIDRERKSVVSSTQIDAWPYLRYAGLWRVRVRNPGGAWSNIFEFMVDLTVTGIEPPSPQLSAEKQLITILGRGFVPESRVVFSHGGAWYEVPPERKEYKACDRIDVWAYLKWPGWWCVRVLNPRAASNAFCFRVGSASSSYSLLSLEPMLQATIDGEAGDLVLSWEGLGMQPYIVQVSEDLVNWYDASGVVMPFADGPISWRDTEAGWFDRRFYRLLLFPE